MSTTQPMQRPVNSSLSGSLKRKLQVFIDIPPSPFHTSSSIAVDKLKAFETRNPGTPLLNKAMNIKQDVASSSKKRKLNPATTQKKPDTSIVEEKNAKWLEKFPNDFSICHHCRQNKALDDVFICTASKGSKSCESKYCGKCVRNHYIKYMELAERKKWSCPRCEGDCVCPRCKKRKGQKQKALKPVYKDLSGKVISSPSQLFLSVDLPISPVSRLGMYLPAAKILPTTKSIRPKKKQIIPEPKWTEVNTVLLRPDVEARLFIREFILRFSQLMNISQTNLEHLDEFDHLSDGATKACIVQLLGLIAADAPRTAQNAIKATMKNLSSTGFNPGTTWTHLSSLRNAVDPSVLAFPDPVEVSSRTVRSRTANAITSTKQLIPVIVALVETAIRGESVRDEIENGMLDIKEKNKHFANLKKVENQRWTEESQKLNEQLTATGKKESGSGSKLSKQLRTASAKHKRTLHDIDCQHMLEVQALAPRFAPLGTDSSGRMYYASTSFKSKKNLSSSERESLHKWSWFLAVWGKRPPSADVTVATDADQSHHLNEEEDADDGDRWWGFADPVEIRKLSKWLAEKEGLNNDTPMDDESPISGFMSYDKMKKSCPKESEGARRPSKTEIKQLIKGLEEYADILAWRIGDEKKI